MTGRVRVVLADDHPLVREGTLALVERTDGLEIVGSTGEGKLVLSLVEQLQPDVLLLDLGLPDLSGIEVARQVRDMWPQVAVVLLTGYGPRNYSQLLPQLGVRALVHKSAPSEELVAAIRAAAEGRDLMHAGQPASASRPEVQPLTVREHEVLALMAAGFRNVEIGGELHVSLNTVEFHVRNILGKLGVRSRTEAVLRARSLGYALPEDVPAHDG